MKIIVKIKKIWGKELFYPISDDAKFLCEMIGSTTLTKRQLMLGLKRGWQTEIIPEISDTLIYSVDD